MLYLDEFSIRGHELVEKEVSGHGNGAHIYVSKEWLGETVKIVRTTHSDDQLMPTKTIEARLVNPTTNKHQKLRETQTAYRRALGEVFQRGCETQSATNDAVVQYDLSGYAKNALKEYVPQLTGDSYNADELSDEHPVKSTNEGFDIDHKPQNGYEWYLIRRC